MPTDLEVRPLPTGVVLKVDGAPLEHMGGGLFRAHPENWRALEAGGMRSRVQVDLGANFTGPVRRGRGSPWGRFRWWLLTGQWVRRG